MYVLILCQVWRGYVQKRRAKVARAEEKIFLKMVCMMGLTLFSFFFWLSVICYKITVLISQKTAHTLHTPQTVSGDGGRQKN